MFKLSLILVRQLTYFFIHLSFQNFSEKQQKRGSSNYYDAEKNPKKQLIELNLKLKFRFISKIKKLKN